MDKLSWEVAAFIKENSTENIILIMNQRPWDLLETFKEQFRPQLHLSLKPISNESSEKVIAQTLQISVEKLPQQLIKFIVSKAEGMKYCIN